VGGPPYTCFLESAKHVYVAMYLPIQLVIRHFTPYSHECRVLIRIFRWKSILVQI